MSRTSDEAAAPLVLYVDDERTNRVVFEAALGDEFLVRVAPDGHAALAVLAAEPVAVLVTDIRMPGMDGLELLRRAKEAVPDVVRIIVTGYSDIEPILAAINEGLVARYIVKPWDRAELSQVLRWGVEAWRFARESGSLYRRLLETERLATLGSMAGMLLHDLKQPLMAMHGNVEVLELLARDAPALAAAVPQLALEATPREVLAERVAELPAVVADLGEACRLLENLIEGLRDLSRPRGVGAVAPATDPVPVVRHALSVCQQLAITARTSIAYEGPRELPLVRISSTALTQILINLVSNGTQAVAARGTPNGSVAIVARAEGEMLELQVRDDGVGMSDEVLRRIGTPFFTTRDSGTGLGIAQCQRLVGTAGGQFRIESTPGIGTTVTIRLPTTA